MTEPWTPSEEVVAVDERVAPGDKRVVVEDDGVVMPVSSPVGPPPAKPAKEADSKACTKHHSRSGQEQPWICIPPWPGDDGRAIHDPRIILRHVNDLRVGGFNHDCLPLLGHLLL